MKIIKLQGQYEKQKGIYYEYDAHSTPLGEGGMGIVYYGHCIEEKTGNSKEVAIKALHPNLPQEVYTRAEREASIRIKHDNAWFHQRTRNKSSGRIHIPSLCNQRIP